MIGLDSGLAAEKLRKTLESIYLYNFKTSFYDHPNTQRIYALNDEKGLVLCSWPKGGRPKLPFVYSDEVWTGIEFQVAAHMIVHGLVDEGLAVVKGVTDRYDGLRRNPWNEVECGSHYARALASWSVLMALSGFRYSAVDERLAFAPAINARDFRCFFAAGSAWGLYSQKVENSSQALRLEVLHGELPLQCLILRNETGGQSLSATEFQISGNKGSWHQIISSGPSVQINFGRQVRIPAGSALSLRLIRS